MPKKVLVTGGAGYVGSVLVPKLLDNNFDVRVLDSMMFGSQGLDSVKEKCEIINGDIRDSDTLKKCLEGIDSVIHLAAISNDPCSDLDPELTRQVNYEATKNLVNLSKAKGVKRFIYASSSSVYGIKEEENVTEDLSLEPLTIYSKTKAMAEEIVRGSNDNEKDFITVSIRPATICGYSPRQRLDLTVNILTEHAINRGKITVFGGEQKRPNVHIEDITDYYLALLEIPKEKIAGETFNAGYENHKVIEIAEIIRKVIGENVEIERTETKDVRSYHISSKKIGHVLGLYPKKTIKDAVADLKQAFEQGLIPDSSSSVYKNIEKMKETNITDTKTEITKQELIEFSDEIGKLWNSAKILSPVHLSGGNENQLMNIFKEIKKGDYIFSTHRSHYHYLLAGGSPEKLKDMIMQGKSMHVFDKELNFLATSILSGFVSTAVGVALALKKQGSEKRVWCFLGDGAEDSGHFYEAVRYVDGHSLPCTFIIEDNDRSGETSKKERFGNSEFQWPKCVKRYYYVPKYPHIGTGEWVDFSGIKMGSNI